MATCPSCINATLDYLGEEEVELPDLETWEKMVRKKVDVYRCPACGHVERVLRDQPRAAQPLLGPISNKQIISGILIIAFAVLTVANIHSPSMWSIRCGIAVFILLVAWLALTGAWALFSTLRTKRIAAKSRRAREKNNKHTRRTASLPKPKARRTPGAPVETPLNATAAPSASSQEPGQAGAKLTVGEGVLLHVESGQLEWEESRTVKTCPKCKSAALIQMLEEDNISPGDIKAQIDPTRPRFYRCPSCDYIVREGPRAMSKATQRRLVQVFFVVGLIESLIEEFAPEAASFAIYVTVMVASLLFVYFYGESQ